MFQKISGIRARFILTIFATVLIFLGAMLVMSYMTLKESALRNAQELSRTVLAQTDMRIDSFFSEIEKLAYALSSYPSFYKVRTDEMKPVILAEVRARSDYLRAIYLGTADGVMHEWGIGEGFVDNVPVLEPDYDPRERPWYSLALEKRGFMISEPYEYASVKAMGITGVMQVYDEENQFVGVLGIDIMLDDLKRIINRMDLGRDGRIILLNMNNQVIISQFDGAYYRNSDLKEFDLFSAEKLEGCEYGHIISPHDHEGRYYVQCTENSMTGWKLVTALPYESVMAHAVKSIRFIAFIDIILMFLLIFVLGYISNVMMIHPLEDITGIMRRIQSGEGNVRLSENRSDEFGTLARQFNRLIDVIRNNALNLEEKVKERTRELQILQRENIRLRIIEEKEKIYGYLHDSLGARLTNIFISNSAARAASGKDPEVLEDMLSRIETNTEQAIDDLKEILSSSEDGSRRIIDFKNLVQVNILNSLELKDIKLTTKMSPSGELNSLSREIRFELEKILQELVNNVLKHSGADAVEVELEIIDEDLALRFSDNGRGGTEIAMKKGGFGLKNIKRRVEVLGGCFEISSPETGGTVISITLPATRNGDKR